MKSLITNHYAPFFPILGKNINAAQCCAIDLSVHNPRLSDYDLSTYQGLDHFIQTQLNHQQAQIGIGGYLEERNLYRLSPHFRQDQEDRCIHLGIDLWTEVQHPVYAPLDGWVHSFAYNTQPLDYGATIILEHQLEATTFYTLYGHLTLASIQNLKTGMPFERGSQLAAIGPHTENGGWVPHLHFQLILDMEDRKGDFLGVTSHAEKAYYASICPDPSFFLTKYLAGDH